MSEVINFMDYKKENLFLVVLQNGERIGLTLKFITKTPVKCLKPFHELPITMYLDFKDVTRSSIDHYIDSDTEFCTLLSRYK